MLSMKHIRFLAMAILAALAVTLATALPGVSADGGEDNQAPLFPEKAELNYPNLGSHLDQLVASVEAGQVSSKDAASNSPVHSGESVAVTVYLTGNVDSVVGFLKDNGGDPRNVGEDYIEAYAPVTLLGRLSVQPGVIRVREIVPPQAAQTAHQIAGNGPAVHGSPAWNLAGYSGQGVKVGIIDGGFEGFSGLMGTELPTTVQARCYTDIGRFTTNLADCENEGSHGTIVAESLMDIAPQVSLYIAHVGTRGDLRNATDWMISEGVKIINTSLSFLFDGPGDGTSAVSNSPLNAVDRAVAGGVVWVTAAGNEAQNAWFSRAPFLDQNRNGIIEFAPGIETYNVTLQAGYSLSVQLRWDGSWQGARTDLDLGLLNSDTEEYVAVSLDPQSGGSGHVPSEFLVFEAPVDGNYGVVVGHVGGGVPGWIQLLVEPVPSIQDYTKNGSIGNPAESANTGLLTVGAAHWDDVGAIEPYSSRGPTPDGRVKPDIVGAASGATALIPLDESNSGFSGTSQASPHVAGLAALVRQRFPGYTPAEVAAYLKDHAQQRETPDPNNTWGHGFAQLPPPDGTTRPVPAPSNAFTRNPAEDFNTLAGASNWVPEDIWSDGTTMWVADWFNEKIYAYDMGTKERVSGKDFDTLQAAGNTSPGGIWSDGETMWVADWIDEKIYAYDMATKKRVSGKDFNTLIAAENTLPGAIWSDGETMWVVDLSQGKIYAYDMAKKERVSDKDFDTLKAARNMSLEGIWSDGRTIWVADSDRDKVFAYDMATKGRVPGREFNTLDAAGNWRPRGIWSDGTTMWISDPEDAKIYAYLMQTESAAERAALVALYNATGGANWANSANWLTNTPIGQWHGVTTDSQGRITELDLRSNQLTGEIPTELADLTSLELLDLGGNELTGPVPDWLGSLTKLWGLYLWGNELTGTIPSELARLTGLEILELGGNELTGTIPPELSSLTRLRTLALGENELTGTIPARLGSLTMLEGLYLWGNGLTGEIPAELGSLANLEELWLSDNQLTGEIPVRFGNASNLVELSLWGNGLTGEIPVELSNSSNLELLSLSANQLSGIIPEELGSLTSLEILELGGNELTGEIPVQLGSASNLAELSLWGNELTGEIPVELSNLSNLELLSLSSNQLTGTLPEELGSLTSLEILELGGNELTGEIPVQLGSASNLVELSLWGNGLTGEIPVELSNLSNLELLSLSSNQLTGTLPEELGNLASLDELDLQDNQLSGTLPEAFLRLTMLERFVFHHNPELCAPVDNAFQTWLQGLATVLGSSCAPEDSPEDRAVLVQVHGATDGANWMNNTNWSSERLTREWYGVTSDRNGRVHGLFLRGNQLTGKIPSDLGDLTKLQRLYLNENQLTGEIPPELGELANLKVLSLGDNQLTGEIPAELGDLTNLTVLHLAGNDLTGCVPASLKEISDNDFAELGLPFCPLSDPLVATYDVNGDGAIDIGELFSAIDDYFAGRIGIGELFTLIDLYFSSPS